VHQGTRRDVGCDVACHRAGEDRVEQRGADRSADLLPVSPEAIRNTAADELAALTPMLRRLLRRIDRIGGALEDGRLTVSVRLLADPSDRRYLTGLVHRVLLAFLAAAAGFMAVLMIGIHGGPALSKTVSLYSFLGYCLLVIAAILAVRVLVQVFRPDPE
jgi:ubiquinone biosynthesis protein